MKKVQRSYLLFLPDICRNVEDVMTMFSKELHELDKNAVQYMIDEIHVR